MNKARIFLVLAFIFVIINSCKKNDSISQSSEDEMFFKSVQVYFEASDKLAEIGLSQNLGPREAMSQVVPLIKAMDGVENVQFVDSTYLIITSNGGYQVSIDIKELDQDGLSVYRGSQNGMGLLRKFGPGGGTAKFKIENNKVLVYAAWKRDFYTSSEFKSHVKDKIDSGEVDIDLQIIEDENCTQDIFETLDQYGLVIFDTHGAVDGIYTGKTFTLNKSDITGSVDAFRKILEFKVGKQVYERYVNKQLHFGSYLVLDPKLSNQINWNNFKGKIGKNAHYIKVSSKGIRELVPDLSNTIIFSNSCYSGFNAKTYDNRGTIINYDPILPAWQTHNPIAYYGYEAANKGISYKADNDFCKRNEDTLIQSFFYDGDSTGMVHLSNKVNKAQQPYHRVYSPYNEGPLNFNLYGKINYSYSECGAILTDKRDNQKYPTVCIGEQIWMAKNLNWAGSGKCFEGNPVSCDSFGRLYNWVEATGGQASGGNPSGVRGACPEGWHVPSVSEWEQLIDFVGGRSVAAGKLKSKTSHWVYGAGTDDYGFRALPGGECSYDITDNTYDCFNQDDDGNFWSTNDSPMNYATHFLISGSNYMSDFATPQNSEYSLRCVKDK